MQNRQFQESKQYMLIHLINHNIVLPDPIFKIVLKQFKRKINQRKSRQHLTVEIADFALQELIDKALAVTAPKYS